MRRRGNGPEIHHNRRLNRRAIEHARAVDERDIGCRPEVAKVFRFVDELGVEREHDVTACMEFGCPLCMTASEVG